MTPSLILPALNLGTLTGLPDWSAAPRGDTTAIAAGLKAAGYKGVQGSGDPAYRAAGLTTYGSGRIVSRDEAQTVLSRQRDEGHLATTLHVGTGLEGDREAMGLIEAILLASDKLGHPAHVESHRATITQDIWRTLRWISHFPEMTFNADLSHWYTGLEMPYGDFDAKLDMLTPFFARVRFMHGRIGTSGIMQVSIGVGGRDEPHLSRFSQMWERCIAGFARHAPPGERLVFAPELLPEVVLGDAGDQFIDYAVPSRQVDGTFAEISDRWDQARKLIEIVKKVEAGSTLRLR